MSSPPGAPNDLGGDPDLPARQVGSHGFRSLFERRAGPFGGWGHDLPARQVGSHGFRSLLRALRRSRGRGYDRSPRGGAGSRRGARAGAGRGWRSGEKGREKRRVRGATRLVRRGPLALRARAGLVGGDTTSRRAWSVRMGSARSFERCVGLVGGATTALREAGRFSRRGAGAGAGAGAGGVRGEGAREERQEKRREEMSLPRIR